MTKYAQTCAKIYEPLKEMSWLQPFMMHYVYFLIINLLYLPTLFSVWLLHFWTLQLLVDKNSNGEISVWLRLVSKNTNSILMCLNKSCELHSSHLETVWHKNINHKFSGHMSWPTTTHRWEKTTGTPASLQISKRVWGTRIGAKPHRREVRNHWEKGRKERERGKSGTQTETDWGSQQFIRFKKKLHFIHKQLKWFEGGIWFISKNWWWKKKEWRDILKIGGLSQSGMWKPSPF